MTTSLFQTFFLITKTKAHPRTEIVKLSVILTWQDSSITPATLRLSMLALYLALLKKLTKYMYQFSKTFKHCVYLLLDFLRSNFLVLFFRMIVLRAWMAFFITTGLSGSTFASCARFSKKSEKNNIKFTSWTITLQIITNCLNARYLFSNKSS